MSENSSLKILLVEDNEMSVGIAETILADHEVLIAKTVSEALVKFKEFSPDITLLDISLPDGSGLDVLVDIKKEDPNAFVAITTASRVKEDMWQAYDKGAKAYIMKPFSSQRLKECVEKYVEHKSEASV